jgi:tetratricopeptide (TPR) repeat protein
LLGDYQGSTAQAKTLNEIPEHLHSHAAATEMIVENLARSHDASGSAAAQGPDPDGDLAVYALALDTLSLEFTPSFPALQRAIVVGDWQAAHDDMAAFDNDPRAKDKIMVPQMPIIAWPWEALTDAMTGDFAGAHKLIDQTPADCYLCVRVRARIFAAEKNWPQAEHWFAEATRQGPSLPFAELEWGEMLLARGDAAGAIEKFKLAAQKGPHFADPLEAWGEALATQGDCDAAVRKFEAANAFAPRWGRLHLKWAEALQKLGRTKDAAGQYALARGLDLSAADKTELTHANP